MIQIFALGIAILRAHPLIHLLIAAAILVGGYYGQQAYAADRAAERAAFAAGPPKSVNIETFDREAHMGYGREVNLRAQLDYAVRYQLTLTGRGADDLAYMIPLLPAEAGSSDPVGMIFVEVGHWDAFNFEDLLFKAQETGALGPIVTLNGRLTSLGDFDEMVAEAFADHGRAYPSSGGLILRPFIEGRGAAMAPLDLGETFVLSWAIKIACAFGLLALARFAIGASLAGPKAKRPAPVARAALPTARVQAFAPVDPVADLPKGDFDTSAAGAPTLTQTEPQYDFQRRLAEKRAAAEVHLADDPAIRSAPASRFSLRNIAIGIVGLAFATALIVAVIGLIQTGMDNDRRAAAAADLERAAELRANPELALAEAVIEVAIPDTQDREVYEIDMAPVMRWVANLAARAAAGDPKAAMTLTFGGLGLLALIIGLPLVLRMWFFQKRRMARRSYQY